MFQIPKSYTDDSLLYSRYDDIQWINHYDLLIELVSDEDRSNLQNYYRSRASHLYREGRYLDSINDLLESNKLENNNDNLVSLSFCYKKLGDLKKAKEILEKYCSLYPHDIFIKDYITDFIDISINSGNIEEIKNDFSRLKKFVVKNDSNLDKIDLKYYTKEYREIVSNREISEGESVLEVGQKAIITTEMGKETEIGKEVLKQKLSLLSKHNWIAFVLLEILRGKNLGLFSYIKTLPKNFNSVPIFYQKEYLDYLKGSQCIQKINDRRLLILKDYQTLITNVPSMKNFTYAEYIWARTVVITRIFGVVIDDNKTQALVPYADMLNHTSRPKTRWLFDDKEKIFKIITKEKLPKGEPIFDTYGKKCNSRFFVNYGFVLDNNIDNMVNFDFDLSCSYIKFLKRKKWHSKFKKVPTTYSIGAKVKNNDKLSLFLAIARYFVCEDEEYFGKSLTPFLYPISVTNEKQALKYIMYLCINHLKRYSRSKIEDLNILLDPLHKYNHSYSRIRNCIIITYGEKQVYDFYLKMCIMSLKILNLDFHVLMKTDLLLQGLQSKYSEYINEYICKILNKNRELDNYLKQN